MSKKDFAKAATKNAVLAAANKTFAKAMLAFYPLFYSWARFIKCNKFDANCSAQSSVKRISRFLTTHWQRHNELPVYDSAYYSWDVTVIVDRIIIGKALQR